MAQVDQSAAVRSFKPAAPSAAPRAVGVHRWLILSFLFFATVVNYTDRQTLSVLQNTMGSYFQADPKQWAVDYSHIVFAFQLAYAGGYLLFGRVVDRVGSKLGYALAVFLWASAQILCAFIGSVTGAIGIVFLLGLGASGNFPAALKVVSEWFPQRERALAVGIFNAGANIGAIVAPLVVPLITLYYGWRMAFVATGSVSLVWLILWAKYYRRPKDHKHISAAERSYIESGERENEDVISWRQLLPLKETWAYAAGKLLTDPVWWFYLFWLPGLLHDRYGLELSHFGPLIAFVYIAADAGSVAGGWMSSALIGKGTSVNVARKLTMLVCALCVLPVTLVIYVTNVWIAVGLIGLAAAAHQAFSANLLTLPTDLFPHTAVASVTGIGGTVGAIGGMAMALFVGDTLAQTGSYTPIFVMAGIMYTFALVIIHALTPKLTPVKL